MKGSAVISYSSNREDRAVLCKPGQVVTLSRPKSLLITCHPSYGRSQLEVTIIISLMHILQILQVQCGAIESTLSGCFSFYISDITLNVITQKALFPPLNNVLEIYPCQGHVGLLHSFNCCSIPHANRPHLTFPFSCVWIFRLFLILWNC